MAWQKSSVRPQYRERSRWEKRANSAHLPCSCSLFRHSITISLSWRETCRARRAGRGSGGCRHARGSAKVCHMQVQRTPNVFRWFFRRTGPFGFAPFHIYTLFASLGADSPGQYGHFILALPRACISRLSFAITCPQGNSMGGFASVACSLLTGHTKMEWKR